MAIKFFKDWLVQKSNTYLIDGIPKVLTRDFGTVYQEGDKDKADYFNEIQKNCVYQVNATRVVEGVVEIYDISLNGSDVFPLFNTQFLVNFNETNTKVDPVLRWNGKTYAIRKNYRFDSKQFEIGEIRKRNLMVLDQTNSIALVSELSFESLIFDTVSKMQSAMSLKLGDVVETLGYTTKNDGLGRKYIITATDVDSLGIAVGSYFASKFYDDNTSYVGKIEYVPFSTPPLGYLKANGATISRTTYARLFTAIGTTFGAGDGSTTFNLPDLRGEFIRGWDDGRGVDSGRVLGSLQLDSIQEHRHSGNTDGRTTEDPNTTYNLNGKTINGITYGASNQSGKPGYNSQTTSRAVPATLTGTIRTAGETRSRNIALMAVIKY